MTPIAEYIRSGQTGHKGRVGIEVEHFLLDHATGKPLPYDRVEQILEQLRPLYDSAWYEDGRLIALKDEQALVTLEPGCQFELSFLYTSDMDELESWYASRMEPVRRLAAAMNADVVCSGGLPTVDAGLVERIPKHRYEYMEAWFAATGQRGAEMMKATASEHISIDYRDEADFVRKVRAANILHPILAFIMANTPDYAGHQNPDILLRDSIWQGTDPARTGIPPRLFEPDFGYEGYAAWLRDIPVILMQDGDKFVSEPDLTIGQAGDKYGWQTEHIQHLLSMAFPDVRVKNFIEIRSADAVRPPFITAYAALVRALFYQEPALDYILSLSGAIEDIQAAKQALRQDGWAASIYGRRLETILQELDRLAEANMNDTDRRHYQPLRQVIQDRRHIYESGY